MVSGKTGQRRDLFMDTHTTILLGILGVLVSVLTKACLDTRLCNGLMTRYLRQR